MEFHCSIALVSRHSAHRILYEYEYGLYPRSQLNRAEYWPLIDLATVHFHGLLLMSY